MILLAVCVLARTQLRSLTNARQILRSATYTYRSPLVTLTAVHQLSTAAESTATSTSQKEFRTMAVERELKVLDEKLVRVIRFLKEKRPVQVKIARISKANLPILEKLVSDITEKTAEVGTLKSRMDDNDYTTLLISPKNAS